jgi:gamma-glutamylcyclotransferase (GGCT)/AIG2-like uncharacterized protein YtfP
MPDTLFVYGSLRSEFDNPHTRQLHKEADLLGPATVRGSIFIVGHYPGYQREPDGVVRGERWRLHNPMKTLRDLDAYEGARYSRIEVEGNWIYAYTGVVQAPCRIESGDFLAR